MKLDNNDPNIEFKRHFVQIVYNYREDPTDTKQRKLQQIVKEAIVKDSELLLWFNAMFKWSNTPYGLDVRFRIELNLPFEG